MIETNAYMLYKYNIFDAFIFLYSLKQEMLKILWISLIDAFLLFSLAWFELFFNVLF